MSKTIIIDGLAVEITKKKVKGTNLRIKEPDARVLVSAPFGKPDAEIIRFVRLKRRWIDINRERILERARTHPAPATKAEKENRRKELKERIANRLPLIEDATGLSCSGWTVRDMHTRWGSCNTSTHHINLSLMLATRTDEELDYVILHELVHTKVANHGPDFYAMMDRYMPGWKTIRRNLKHK